MRSALLFLGFTVSGLVTAAPHRPNFRHALVDITTVSKPAAVVAAALDAILQEPILVPIGSATTPTGPAPAASTDSTGADERSGGDLTGFADSRDAYEADKALWVGAIPPLSSSHPADRRLAQMSIFE